MSSIPHFVWFITLYIDRLGLESIVKKMVGEGVNLASYLVKLLLYADDLILILKIEHGLREHLKALEHFCQEVRMQVNIAKAKIMIFSLNRKDKPTPFFSKAAHWR